MKSIDIVYSKHKSQRDRKFQGTRAWFLKVLTTKRQSDSNQTFLKFLFLAVSKAISAAKNSAMTEDSRPRGAAKLMTWLAFWSLKIHPQAEGQVLATPLMLHLIHQLGGRIQSTSLVRTDLHGWILMLYFLRKLKLGIEELETFLVWLPIRLEWAAIRGMRTSNGKACP